MRLAKNSNTTFVLLLTLSYILCFVSLIWLRQWQLAGHDRPIFLPYLLTNIGFAVVQIFCFFFALTLNRYLLAAVLPPVFAASGFYLYAVQTFGVPVNNQTIAVVFESTGNEIMQFVTPLLLAILLGAILLSLAAVFYFRRKVTLQPQERAAAKACLVLTACLILLGNGSMSVDYPPYDIITASVQYGWERFTDHAALQPAQGFSYAAKAPAPLAVVVIIGESARADHLALYGYDRPTSPYTSKLKNLLVFSHVKSCGVLTRIAVPCIMTHAVKGGATSLLSVFNSLGFHTAWLGAQGAFSSNDPVTRIINQAQDSTLLERRKLLDNSVLDQELLPLFDKELQKDAGKPSFTVLHLYGSHWQYQARYPESFDYFKPTCDKTYERSFNISDQIDEIRACAIDHPRLLINAYDNSIRYTDYIISQVIARLKHKNALVVYLSDHAESLGEGGRYMHGNPKAPEQWHIPMLWWASDSFIAAHAGKWHELSKNTGLALRENTVFPSVLNCIGIHSATVSLSDGLCNNPSGAHLP